MKAKVIATGEVIDVEKHSYDYVLKAHTYKDVNSGRIYAFYDLQFGYKETKRNTYIPEKINWEQRRFELVKTAMQGMLSNKHYCDVCCCQQISERKWM